MTLRQLKKLVQDKPVEAKIVSDGCRDYVVEIRQPNGADHLQDHRGRTRRFPALSEAHRVLRRARVADIELAVRIAADEACAGPALADCGFATLKFSENSPV